MNWPIMRKRKESWERPDTQHIDLRPGMRLVIPPESKIDTLAHFAIAMVASGGHDGIPVLCRDFLPQLDLEVKSSILFGDIVELKGVWDPMLMLLERWLEKEEISTTIYDYHNVISVKVSRTPIEAGAGAGAGASIEIVRQWF